MPRYEYLCPHCKQTTVLRRAIDEMDEPAECLNDGSPLARQFTTTSNLFVPLHFQSVRKGGQEGGYSWSDFHGDRTLKEMAQAKEINGQVAEFRHIDEARSEARHEPTWDERVGPAMEKAFDRAFARVGPAPEGES